MKKAFKYYLIVWAIMLALFNLVTFLIRPVLPGFVILYDARFWIAWVFAIVGFIGNIVCTYIALKSDSLQKTFYKLPLIRISYIAMITLTVINLLFINIPNFPAWITAILDCIILGLNAIVIVKAAFVADVVAQTDEKIKEKTSFIKNITVDAENLVARAKSEEAKAECKKVYEAFRYSDPVSSSELADIESELKTKMNEFSSFVASDDVENIKTLSSEITLLAGDRNRKCKSLK